MPLYGRMLAPARKRFRPRSLPPQNGWRSRCARDLLAKYSLPAPRSSATTRRPPAPPKAASTRISAAAPRSPRPDKDIQYQVQKQPAKTGRNDEQGDESD